MINVFIDEEMEAPCICERCGEWFDLDTGRSLPGSNVIICRECHTEITTAPKGKERKDLRKDDIVWSYNDNESGLSGCTHGYYQDMKEHAAALCNSRYHVGDGSKALPVDELDGSSEYKYGCGRCKRIYDKLPY